VLPDRANERREGARGVPELQPQHPDCVQRAGIRRQVCEQRLEARSGAHAIAGSVSFDCSGEDPLVGLRLPIGLRGKTSFFLTHRVVYRTRQRQGAHDNESVSRGL